VQQLARQVYPAGGPGELHSLEQPSLQSAVPDGLYPIEPFYGLYSPSERVVRVYQRNIDRDAKVFGAKPDELKTIVRIHEHAHGIFHIGLSTDYEEKIRAGEVTEVETDWTCWLAKRTKWAEATREDVHELIAQALTWGALTNLQDGARSERLCGVFERLEEKQPPHYQLSDDVKEGASNADWPTILDVVRGEVQVVRSFRLGWWRNL
jgi:hypothetical protein